MVNHTQIHLGSSILSSLGLMFSDKTNPLSPLRPSRGVQASMGEFQAAGLANEQGKLKTEIRPWLQVLVKPASLVDLRISAGSYFQQFSLYYGENGNQPVLLMNRGDGLLLEQPADTESVLDGLVQFSGDSLLASFNFEASLPYGPALALAVLVDLHRREVARAFADLTPAHRQPANATEMAYWLSTCPDSPQWLTALVRTPEDRAPDVNQLQAYLDALVAAGYCQPSGGGYELAASTRPIGNRLVMLDTFYTLDIARLDPYGRVEIASLSAVQAGVNDLLQIEFQGDLVRFVSLSPMAFGDQVRHFLENGGSGLPDLQDADPLEPVMGSNSTRGNRRPAYNPQATLVQ
ncbi:MAG: hypothetical protein JW862_12845 [Anaerolineales bacterium]|nr:hypothetical protein [Anaerolineales bacterium]